MFVSLIAACVVTPLSATVQERPTEVIGGLFKKYYDAQSVEGTMTSRYYEGNRLISTVETEVAFIRNPAKIYIRQEKTNHTIPGSEKDVFMVIGDGKNLSYNVPVGSLRWEERKSERLIEPIVPGISTVETQYALVTSSLSDRTAPLDIAFARTEDLQAYQKLWYELIFQERQDAPAGAKVIGGRLRPFDEAPPSGSWQIVLGPNLDMIRYETNETFSVDGQQLTLRAVHDVDFKLNVSIPDSKFVQR